MTSISARLWPAEVYSAPGAHRFSHHTPGLNTTNKNVEDIYPLSPVQLSLLFAHLRDPRDDPGQVLVRCWLEGRVDRDLLQDCWHWVVQRHPVLRSSIHWQQIDQPLQVVRKSVKPAIQFKDVSTLDDGEKQQATESLLQEERNRPLRLDQAPTFRIVLLSFPDNTHYLCWTCHHILVDGWSASIVLSDLVGRYQDQLLNQDNSKPPPRRYHDYITWTGQQDVSTAQRFWRDLSPPRSARKAVWTGVLSSIGAAEQPIGSAARMLDADTKRHADNLIQTRQTTLGLTIQAAWVVFLHQLCQSRNVEYLVTVSGRSIQLPGIDAMVGQFSNSLPLTVRVNPEQKFVDVLERVSELSGRLREFEYVTPTQIQDWGISAEGQTRTRIGQDKRHINSLVVVENFPWTATEHVDHESSIRITSLSGDITSKFPFTLTVVGGDDITLRLDLRGQHDPQLPATLLDGLVNLIAGLFASPAGEIGATGEKANPGLTAEHVFASSSSLSGTDATAQQLSEYVPPRDEVELQLTAIWQQAFRRKRIGSTDDFFDIGGDSIIALSIYADMEKIFDVKLPLSTIIEYRTITELAKLIRKPGQYRFRSLVPMQLGSQQTSPVFGIHAEGDVVFYKDLARALGTEQSFYGLQAIHLDGTERPFNRIEDMAAHYISEIREVQARGPYTLVGMCFGGLIAFEMARQLVADGEQLNALVVIDAAGPDLPMRKKLWTHLKDGRLGLVVKRRIQDALVRNRRNVHKSLDKNKQAQLDLQNHPAKKYNSQLMKRYQAKSLHGRIVCIRNQNLSEQEMARWREFASNGVEDYLLPGNHANIMEPPYVYEIAEIISRKIAS